MSFDLEYQDQRLGGTRIRSYIPLFTKVDLDAPIHGTTGSELGQVTSRQRPRSLLGKALGPKATFDYRLACAYPTSPPIPTLLLATTFAHHLYDTLDSLAPFSQNSQ